MNAKVDITEILKGGIGKNPLTGVVIVPHGSRTEESQGIYEAIAQKAQERIPHRVKIGYMKHGRPNIVEAIQEYIREGTKRIVIVPLFIVPGLHVRDDIPALLGLKEGVINRFGYPRMEIPEDVELLYAPHIGADDRLVDVLIDRTVDVLK